MRFFKGILPCALFLATSVLSKEDLTLTQSQKQKLDKLKQAVLPILPYDWMKEDLILLRYLKARVWDVRRATDSVKESVRWWRDYGKSMLEEEFPDFEKEYPMYTDGVDNIGQPILTFNFGEFDVRKVALQGQIKPFIKYLFKRRHDAIRRSWEYNKQGKTNGTQFDFILNLDKFNQNQHLCAQCLQVYTEWTSTYESHYPGSADKIILVNSPSTFEVVLTLIRPLFSPATSKALQVYGSKTAWEPVLYKDIKRDQLPEAIGGSRNYS